MDAGHDPPGGGPSVASEDQIRYLAEAALLGLPVVRMYRTRDPEEAGLLRAMHQEAIKVADEVRRDLARKIVEEYGQAKERGERRGSK